jgi:HSP20 family protein
MATIRCQPFQDFTQKDLNRFLSDFSTRLFGEVEQSTRTWAPPVDIYDTDNALVLKADLPGVDPKGVQIRIEDGVLYLSGERKAETDVKEENYHRMERSYGTFSRSFSLPSSIDAEHVNAEYKDGQLILTMPKREEAKPKTVKINVNES